VRCPHTSFTPGRRILVRQRDGKRYVAKYVQYRSNYVVLRCPDTDRAFRLAKPDIQVLSYYRPQPGLEVPTASAVGLV
jgi:hypothetical protein